MPVKIRTTSGLSLYVLFDDASDTAVNLTEGSSLKAGWYTAADAAIAAASLAAGTYDYSIMAGLAANKSAGDLLVGANTKPFRWNGTSELHDAVDLLAIAGTSQNAPVGGIAGATELTQLANVVDNINSSASDILEDTANMQPKLGTFATGTAAGDIAAVDAGVSGLVGTQPRINYEPDIVLKISSRRAGNSSDTYLCDRPVKLLPGTFDVEKTVGIDMSAFYKKRFVSTVGAPTVSGGSITCEELGPRDTLAVVQLDGTATASESRTVDVPITMVGGGQHTARFEIEVGE